VNQYDSVGDFLRHDDDMASIMADERVAPPQQRKSGVENGVGFGPYSPLKQTDLRGLLKTHAFICKGIFERFPDRRYLYVDANAGPGYVPAYNIPGSPLIAMEELQAVLPPLKIDFHFCESNPINTQSLRERLSGDYQITEANNQMAVPALLATKSPMTHGIVYHDPTNLVDFDLLRFIFGDHAPRIDLLVYLSAANHKRNGIRLDKELATINKNYWLIREVTPQFQFTFLLGTNWDGYPDWKAHGFYKLNSARGQHILDLVSNSKGEREARDNQRLPGL
jgi:hypothetical protein